MTRRFSIIAMLVLACDQPPPRDRPEPKTCREVAMRVHEDCIHQFGTTKRDYCNDLTSANYLMCEKDEMRSQQR